ncbi:Aste57867_10703 [Aphanomyces stellatus]|uniref:Aste57867_10703 protein n=1 Tax=Aphanomyces stellatus TaxID=120398 RepID=A0A485KR37_9STRA|nr:hypothetical protein As57867_010663 [Aphanomyces stellatus]VFT87573.1 Aste57867_10703 [Aphanomyces stellatus]
MAPATRSMTATSCTLPPELLQQYIALFHVNDKVFFSILEALRTRSNEFLGQLVHLWHLQHVLPPERLWPRLCLTHAPSTPWMLEHLAASFRYFAESPLPHVAIACRVDAPSHTSPVRELARPASPAPSCRMAPLFRGQPLCAPSPATDGASDVVGGVASAMVAPPTRVLFYMALYVQAHDAYVELGAKGVTKPTRRKRYFTIPLAALAALSTWLHKCPVRQLFLGGFDIATAASPAMPAFTAALVACSTIDSHGPNFIQLDYRYLVDFSAGISSWRMRTFGIDDCNCVVLDPAGFSCLCLWVAQSTHLETLELLNLDAPSTQMTALRAALTTSSVTQLILYEGASDGLERLVHDMAAWLPRTSLTHWTLSNVRRLTHNPAYWSHMYLPSGSALWGMRRLVVVDLTHARIVDRCLPALFDGVQNNTSLQRLILDRNSLTTQGAATVIQQVSARSCPLALLSLRHNKTQLDRTVLEAQTCSMAIVVLRLD